MEVLKSIVCCEYCRNISKEKEEETTRLLPILPNDDDDVIDKKNKPPILNQSAPNENDNENDLIKPKSKGILKFPESKHKSRPKLLRESILSLNSNAFSKSAAATQNIPTRTLSHSKSMDSIEKLHSSTVSCPTSKSQFGESNLRVIASGDSQLRHTCTPFQNQLVTPSSSKSGTSYVTANSPIWKQLESINFPEHERPPMR